MFYDMQPYSKNWSFVTYLDESEAPSDWRIYYSINGVNDSRQCLYTPGLTRLVFDATQNNPKIGFASYGKHIFINGGYTQPINMVLYNYMNKPSNTASYVTPGNDFNRVALKQLTTDVCAKLKSDHGNNLRIYIVKYRKQTQYNALLRNGAAAHKDSTKNFSDDHAYDAVDACASSSNYVYDIADNANAEANLKAALANIAADIKSASFANYRPAKNVE